jgi:hypothetical protein
MIHSNIGVHRSRSIRLSRPGRIGLSPHFFEALESRQLMTSVYGVTFPTLTLPAHPVTGIVAKGAAKITLTNISNNAALPTDKADLHIVARPTTAVGNSTDIDLGTLKNQNIGITVGSSKSYNFTLTIPAITAAGQYDILAIVDAPAPSGALILESSSAAVMTEEAQNFDLHTTLGTSTIPNAVIGGGTVVGTLQVKLTNDGNITDASTEKATIELFARPVGGGADVPLTTQTSLANQAIGGMKPAGFKNYTAKVIFPTTITSGDYVIVATATATGVTPENNAGNNTVVSGQTLHVTQGFLDFSTTFVGDKLPSAIIAGNAAAGSVQLKVTNLGNIDGSPAEKVDIAVVAHPMGGGSDIPLKTLLNQSVAKIKAGTGVKPFTVPLVFSGTLSAATYQIVVTTTADGPGVDTSSTNNSFTAADTVTVAPAFVDLSIPLTTTTLSGSVLGGTSGPASISVKNLGNIQSTGYTVEVFATTNGTIAGGDTPIGTTNSATAKIAAGATVKVPVTITLPAVVSSTPYTLVARVTLAGDTNAGNNTTAMGTVTATPTPPILGNEPASVSFIEKTSNTISVLTTTHIPLQM